MRFDIVTVFPEMVRAPLEEGVVGRAIERGLVVAGQHFLVHPLKAGVAEVGGMRVEVRKLVVVAINHSDIMLAAKVEESVVAEAFVSRLDRVAQLQAIQFTRQQLQEAGDVLAVELPKLRQHP